MGQLKVEGGDRGDWIEGGLAGGAGLNGRAVRLGRETSLIGMGGEARSGGLADRYERVARLGRETSLIGMGGKAREARLGQETSLIGMGAV